MAEPTDQADQADGCELLAHVQAQLARHRNAVLHLENPINDEDRRRLRDRAPRYMVKVHAAREVVHRYERFERWLVARTTAPPEETR